MPAPHGQSPQTESFLFRHSAEESKFLRGRALELGTSMNAVLRRIVQDAMPSADPRADAIDAIEEHKVECTLCTAKGHHPQCTEGRKLKARYDATLPPPPPPRPNRPAGARRPLKARGLVPGLDPVAPVTGQTPLPEGDAQ